MILALFIGLFILIGTLTVYGPSIVAITLLASGFAYLIGRLWRTQSEVGAQLKSWVLRGAVLAIATFAFTTGFLQTLDPKRAPVPWLPAAAPQPAASALQPSPTATGLEGIRGAPIADRDHLCQMVCANGSSKWDPKYFERSELYDLPNDPTSAGLRCYYQEMPLPPDDEERVSDAELDKRCAERGASDCWWSIKRGVYGEHASCMRPIFPTPAGG